jgi:membrane-bound lytic murein transglycosylase D
MRILLICLGVILLSACNATLDDLTDVQYYKTSWQQLTKASTNPSSSLEKQDDIPELVHPAEEITDSLSTIVLNTDESSTDTTVPIEPKAQTHTDLWAYLAANMTLPVTQHTRLQSKKEWYLKHPQYMQRVAKRAGPFLFYIAQELEKRDLPLELALLPIVESSFDPFAYSHGRAAGMWQFIPSTGKRYGMEQNWWYDGRRDVIASTQGALDYLTYLHKYFDGNWYHALAAYNSGEGRVRRAIRKNRKAGKPTDFWSLSLPKETRSYVPKLLALVEILKNTEAHNFAWPHIPNKPVIDIIDVDSQIDLALAAEFSGLSLTELHALNPGYNRWATAPNGPHRLVIPLHKSEEFSQQLAATAPEKRINWVRHKVKSGESLGLIAQNYTTSINVIKSINELASNVIYQGQYLLVPVALKSLDEYQLSQTQRLAKLQNKPSQAIRIKHKVVTGDTLWDLAKKYKVSTQAIARWNGMAPKDYIRPGQTLVIRLPKGKNSGIVRNITYTVRSGDSLARIGQKFGVKIKDIIKWNQIAGQKYLQPGQKLKLAVDVTKAQG